MFEVDSIIEYKAFIAKQKLKTLEKTRRAQDSTTY